MRRFRRAAHQTAIGLLLAVTAGGAPLRAASDPNSPANKILTEEAAWQLEIDQYSSTNMIAWTLSKPAMMPWRLISIHVGVDAHGEVWVVRRVIGTQSTQSIAWADSRTCPIISSLIDDLGKLAVPFETPAINVHVPLKNRRAFQPSPDGTYYVVTVLHSSPGKEPTTVRIEQKGGMFADWHDRLNGSLAKCWTDHLRDGLAIE